MGCAPLGDEERTRLEEVVAGELPDGRDSISSSLRGYTTLPPSDPAALLNSEWG